MKLRALVTSVIAAASLCVGWGQATNYAISSHPVKVGTLVQASGVQGFSSPFNSSAPYFWPAMNLDKQVKPPEWQLVNPIGPSNGAIADKTSPFYWEVSLDNLTPANAAQFDVLLLPISNELSLTPSERETLRSFVDQGGVLWMDVLGAAFVDPGQGLMQDFALVNSPLSGIVSADYGAELLTSPNILSSSEVADLSAPGVTYRLALSPATGLVPGINDSAHFGYYSYRPVIIDSSGQPVVSQASVGSGMVVVTGQGVSANLNNAAGAQGNLPWTSRTALQRRALVSSKLVCNIISLSSGFSRPGGNSRGSGTSHQDASAPMVRTFVERGNYSAAAGPAQSPAAYNGKVVVREGTDLVCYQADPRLNTDPSVVVGGSKQLWRVPGLGDFSSPLVIDVPSTTFTDSTGKATGQVWVAIAGGTGAVYSLNTGQLLTPGGISGLPLLSGGGAMTPVQMESIVYFVGDDGSGSSGVITAVDANTATVMQSGTTPWTITAPTLGVPSAPPVIAYIPVSPGSTALDKVLYIPTKANTGGATNTCGLASIWVGATGDYPLSATYSPGAGSPTVYLTLRPFANGGLPVIDSAANLRSVKVTVLDYLGNILPSSTYLAGTSQTVNGTVTVNLTPAAVGFKDWDNTGTDPTKKVSWRVDYDLDWGVTLATNGVAPSNAVRGSLYFPDRADHAASVLGSPAIGPNGHIAVVVSRPFAVSPGTGGTYFNLIENSFGLFQVRTRWDMHDGIASAVISGFPTLIQYPGAIQDNDDLAAILGQFNIANGKITEQRFSSPPVIKGDTVYIMAEGRKDISGGGTPVPVPVGFLLAFNAQPDPVQFNLGTLPAVGQESSLSIIQPDVALSNDPSNPTSPSTLHSPDLILDRASGSAGSSSGKVVIPNLAGSIDGVANQLNSVISCNLPIFILRSGNSTPQAVQPEAGSDWSWIGQPGVTYSGGGAAGKFDPLRYFQVIMGYKPQGQPVVAGSTIFMSGASVLPSILTSGFTSFTYVGLLSAQDTDISGTDSFLKPNPVKNWQLQLQAVQAGTGNYAAGDWSTLKPNPDIRWPYYSGITSLDDLRIRVNQAALDDSSVINMAADEDNLFAIGTSGGNGALYAYNRLNILLTDSGRVARFDAIGNPRWILQGTKSYLAQNQVSDSSTSSTLSDPLRVYPAGTTAQWIVDPGTNAVIKVDNAGNELRHIDKFKIDPNSARGLLDGVKADEPLNLKGPRDITTYVDYHTAAEVATFFPSETITNTIGAMTERWEHTVIADSGNSRLIELIDRYLVNSDGTIYAPVRYLVGTPSPDDEGDGSSTALGVLLWHSPENLSGTGYAYTAIDRLRVTTGTPHNVFTFGFNNVAPGKTTFGLDSSLQSTDTPNGNGGVVILDGAQTKVIRQIQVLGYNAGTFLGANGSGGYDFLRPTVNVATAPMDISGLKSVSTRYVLDSGGNTVLAVMISMAKGVYEVYESTPGVWTVRWMLPNDAYVGMRRPNSATPYTAAQLASNPVSFHAAHATRLPSGDVMIVNGYVGTKYDGSETGGEVVLVDGSLWNGDPASPGFSLNRPNFGFNSLSVKFILPPISGARGIYRPAFAVRQ